MKAGDWVEVRAADEILASLDSNGELDGLPFMPEMLAWCGQRLQVYKSAHKTCDTVFPVRGRRMHDAVHLATRCDGRAHGGCQASCLLFWKEAWLKPVAADRVTSPQEIRFGRMARPMAARHDGSRPPDLYARACHIGTGGEKHYVCQATRLPDATSPLAWWDVRQYVRDYASANVSLRRMFDGLCHAIYLGLLRSGLGLGRPLRYLYDKVHVLWGGGPFPHRSGSIPEGSPTPAVSLDLQPGELVRVKPYAEILKTLTKGCKNRGMWWDAEMVPFCGGKYKVLKRVTRIVDERTGKMQEMKTPCIILQDVICQARYSSCRRFCPRGIYPYWREIWLERVGARTEAPSERRSEELVDQS